MPTPAWNIVDRDARWTPNQQQAPLEELAAGSIPAIVFRRAYDPLTCHALVERLLERDLLYDPSQPMPARFRDESIPEGYYREGRQSQASQAWTTSLAGGGNRIDIGTSLGYRGSNKEEFLAHSQQTRALFGELFAELDSPVETLYGRLQCLAGGKQVTTAREADGREYGPAIIRAHYGGYSYRPHYDSVRNREKRTDYAVYGFDHQFAGVLVLQNTQLKDESAQCVLHRCFWHAEVDPHLKEGTFHDYAREQQIQNVRVCLNPGDLYFFNTGMIHEVPGVAGELPRIVVAVFIGYSSDRDEVFVWS